MAGWQGRVNREGNSHMLACMQLMHTTGVIEIQPFLSFAQLVWLLEKLGILLCPVE